MLASAALTTRPFRPLTAQTGATGKATLACSSCSQQWVCMPGALEPDQIERFGALVSTKRRIVRGQALYRSGDAFEYLYAVRCGAFKSVSVSRHGDEKITGFHLAGELMGLDAISAGRYGVQAVALEDSEVCAIPFAALSKMALSVPALQQQIFRVLSSDISRDQGLMLLLGSMSAEQRLAAFLMGLARRYQRLGFAADRFVLRMTREEIGNYLGLTLETVSRLFSRFQRDGLLSVKQRDITLKRIDRLREIVG